MTTGCARASATSSASSPRPSAARARPPRNTAGRAASCSTAPLTPAPRAAGAPAARPARVPRTGATASVARRVAEEPLDEHAVAPLPVEAAVASLHPDLLESSRQVDRPARGVGGEDP